MPQAPDRIAVAPHPTTVVLHPSGGGVALPVDPGTHDPVAEASGATNTVTDVGGSAHGPTHSPKVSAPEPQLADEHPAPKRKYERFPPGHDAFAGGPHAQRGHRGGGTSRSADAWSIGVVPYPQAGSSDGVPT